MILIVAIIDYVVSEWQKRIEFLYWFTHELVFLAQVMNGSIELVIVSSIVFVKERICLELLAQVLVHHRLCF